MNSFIQELKWRGMLQDMTPELEEHLAKGMASAYLGFDPTADSLHIGHLVGVMTLLHFQRAGHQPVALVGGATGMIGDPSFKSAERNLLDKPTLDHNVACIQKQLAKFLDFSGNQKNNARLVNNYDWISEFTFLDFIRDVGKHITVNYMMSKDSVKRRLEDGNGLSFTEFSYALTVPLITKADGTKFGKTEGGSVWLDPEKTSPYAFYQFWLNVSDADASKYIRIFTVLDQATVERLEKEHAEAPHLRLLQKEITKEVTCMVHSTEDYEMALKASEILFGKSSTEDLASLDERTFLAVFEGVPKVQLSRSVFTQLENVLDLLGEKTNFELFPSKGEARKMIQGGGVSINKEKVADPLAPVTFSLLQGKYLLVQKGKKNYVIVEILP